MKYIIYITPSVVFLKEIDLYIYYINKNKYDRYFPRKKNKQP